MSSAANLTNCTIVNSEIPPDHPSKREIEQALRSILVGLSRRVEDHSRLFAHQRLVGASRGRPRVRVDDSARGSHETERAGDDRAMIDVEGD